MPKQKLSIKARIAKAARDLRAAKTPARRAKKRDAQRRRRNATCDVSGKDFDHKTGKFISIKKNRGNSGNGTKKESGASYYVAPKANKKKKKKK